VFDEEFIKRRIRVINDYPKEGIVFRDITTLLKNKRAFKMCINQLAKLAGKDFDYVVGIEARGFILGSALAYKLGKGFIPIRKKGKLPFSTVSKDYKLEYGSATIEMHSDAIKKGEKVLIVDDLLATGGTAKAAAELIAESGGEVESIIFLVELSELGGRNVLKDYNTISLIKY
jgi:adenine phosphoribosyltransferase